MNTESELVQLYNSGDFYLKKDSERLYHILFNLKLLNIPVFEEDEAKLMIILEKELMPFKCILSQTRYLYNPSNIIVLYSVMQWVTYSWEIMAEARFIPLSKEELQYFHYRNEVMVGEHLYQIKKNLSILKKYIEYEFTPENISRSFKSWLPSAPPVLRTKKELKDFLARMTPSMYLEVLTRAVFRAPTCKESFTVFRYSVEGDIIMKDSPVRWSPIMNMNVGEEVIIGTPQATAIIWNRTAMEPVFLHYKELEERVLCSESCCLQVIHVPKNFPCLILEVGFRVGEMLLPPHTRMKVLGFRKINKNTLKEEKYSDNVSKKEWIKEICEDEDVWAVVDLQILGLEDIYDPGICNVNYPCPGGYSCDLDIQKCIPSQDLYPLPVGVIETSFEGKKLVGSYEMITKLILSQYGKIKDLTCTDGIDIVTYSKFSDELFTILLQQNSDLISFIDIETNEILCLIKSQLKEYWNMYLNTFEGRLEQPGQEFEEVNNFLNFNIWENKYIFQDGIEIILQSLSNVFFLISTQFQIKFSKTKKPNGKFYMIIASSTTISVDNIKKRILEFLSLSLYSNLNRVDSLVFKDKIPTNQQKKALMYILTHIDLLWNLGSIDIEYMHLNTVPEPIFNVRQLSSLNLSNNDITEIPSEIAELENLFILNLSNNNLKNLPTSIENLKRLYELNISNNDFKSLPESIYALINLRVLRVSNNNLESISNDINKLKNLNLLNLSNNNLRSLPEGIIELKRLDNINLSNNDLYTLPEEFWKKVKRRSMFFEINILGNPNLKEP